MAMKIEEFETTSFRRKQKNRKGRQDRQGRGTSILSQFMTFITINIVSG